MNAQSSILSEESYISLLTEGPGVELYSGYGHTGIRIKDVAQNLDIVYHYGLFDFEAPGFYANFLKGKLNYKMGGQYYSSFYNSAKSEKRTLTEQILNFNQAEKNELYRLLNENYLPENRAYWYDFFFDNCSTRPRDFFENVFSSTLNYKKKNATLSFRQLLETHQQYFPWTDFGIDLLHGSNTDKLVPVRDEMFLPIFLMKHLSDAKIDGEPAIREENRLLKFPDKPLPKIWEKPSFIFILLFILECLLFYFWWIGKSTALIYLYDRIWFILVSLSAILMIFMWFGTDHYAAKYNWNVLWASPSFIWMSIAKLKAPTKRTILTAKIIMLTLLICFLGWYLIPQTFHIAVLPILGILVLKMVRVVFRNELTYNLISSK